MTDDKNAADYFYELFEYHRARIKQEPEKDFSEELIGQLSTIQEPSRRNAYIALILHEAKRVGNDPVYEKAAVECCEEFPDDVMTRIGLASHYLYSREQPETAFVFIEDAISVAYRTRNFRRHALATKARIALGLKNRDLWEQSLYEIMQLKFKPGDLDIGSERDFIDQAPVEYQQTDVARKYLDFLRSSKQHNKSNE